VYLAGITRQGQLPARTSHPARTIALSIDAKNLADAGKKGRLFGPAGKPDFGHRGLEIHRDKVDLHHVSALAGQKRLLEFQTLQAARRRIESEAAFSSSGKEVFAVDKAPGLPSVLI
jgi:hypothetical protein